MEFSYEIYREGVILATTDGGTYEDFLAVLGPLREDMYFQPGMKVLIDCRNTRFKPTNVEDTRPSALQ